MIELKHMNTITIPKKELKTIIKESIREIFEQELIKFRALILPFVSQKEQKDIERRDKKKQQRRKKKKKKKKKNRMWWFFFFFFFCFFSRGGFVMPPFNIFLFLLGYKW